MACATGFRGHGPLPHISLLPQIENVKYINMPTVRTATPTDQEGVLQVEASATATLRKTYRPTKRAMANKKNIEKQLIRLVAEEDGRIVGTVQYEITENTLHMIGLGVHEAYRRKGIARKIIGCLSDIGRARSLRSISLFTIKETGNVPIFEKLRFEVVSETLDEFFESDRFGSLTEVKMVRRLTLV